MPQQPVDGTVPPHPADCLACGSRNPASMGLVLRVEADRIVGSVAFDARQQGAPGIAHGGAVATVLDDTLGSVLMLLGRPPAMTTRLSVDFRAPAVLGRELAVEAWSERDEGRKFYLAARLLDQGRPIAEAQALFLAVDAERFRHVTGSEDTRWLEWTGAAEREAEPTEALDDRDA